MTTGMTINDMSFKVGQTLTFVGEVKPDTKHFFLNIGLDQENIALHINPRFDANGDKRQVVFNSFHGGKWQAEVREGGFPFRQEEQFKIITIFTPTGFVVVLSDGSTILFPNHLGSLEYNYFSYVGEIRIRSFDIM